MIVKHLPRELAVIQQSDGQCMPVINIAESALSDDLPKAKAPTVIPYPRFDDAEVDDSDEIMKEKIPSFGKKLSTSAAKSMRSTITRATAESLSTNQTARKLLDILPNFFEENNDTTDGLSPDLDTGVDNVGVSDNCFDETDEKIPYVATTYDYMSPIPGKNKETRRTSIRLEASSSVNITSSTPRLNNSVKADKNTRRSQPLWEPQSKRTNINQRVKGKIEYVDNDTRAGLVQKKFATPPIRDTKSSRLMAAARELPLQTPSNIAVNVKTPTGPTFTGPIVKSTTPVTKPFERVLALERTLGYSGGPALILYEGKMMLIACGSLLVLLDVEGDGVANASSSSPGLWRAFKSFGIRMTEELAQSHVTKDVGGGVSSSSVPESSRKAPQGEPDLAAFSKVRDGTEQAFLRGHTSNVGLLEVRCQFSLFIMLLSYIYYDYEYVAVS